MLVGRNAEKLAAVAQEHAREWTTDLDAALADPAFTVFFDAAATISARPCWRRRSPPASTSIRRSRWRLRSRRAELLRAAKARGLKHGAVEDKLYLPGLQKLAQLAASDFSAASSGSASNSAGGCSTAPRCRASGRAGTTARQDGGGLILDMYPHWRYVIENTLGPMRRVITRAVDRDARADRRAAARATRRRRGQRLDAGRARERRDRHHPVVLGDAGAARRPADVPDRRQQRLGHRRPAPLLDARPTRRRRAPRTSASPPTSTSTIAPAGRRWPTGRRSRTPIASAGRISCAMS